MMHESFKDKYSLLHLLRLSVAFGYIYENQQTSFILPFIFKIQKKSFFVKINHLLFLSSKRFGTVALKDNAKHNKDQNDNYENKIKNKTLHFKNQSPT